MKLVKIYEAVLREGEAQSCIANFGKELFDPQLDVNGEPSNVEPNTDIEKNYLELIINFTNIEHGVMLNKNFINAIDNLKKCATTYPEVLQPLGVAYRGIRLSLKELLHQYDDIADDLSSGGEFTLNYKSKTLIQSWSSDEDIADGFAKNSWDLLKAIRTYREVKDDDVKLGEFIHNISPNLDNILCPITIELQTTKDDFLFKSKYFSELSLYRSENELLRITNKPTIVKAKIVSSLLKDVYGILNAIMRYQNSQR